jgi:TetR/AcrR family transcriptional repressor of nem operon
MSNTTQTQSQAQDTKHKLMNAGVRLMRERGYHATTVDDICKEAGVTKGGFFHYFKSKDDIAKAAATQFYEDKVRDYEAAPFRKLSDPLERIFGRLDFVKATVGGENRVTKGCLLGMFAQELAFTNPEIRDLCNGFFSRIVADVADDLAEGQAVHAPSVPFDPNAVAQMYVSIIQGSLMLAKIAGNNEALGQNIEQFRSHIRLLFGHTTSEQWTVAAGESAH